jgi:hypothetical protein
MLIIAQLPVLVGDEWLRKRMERSVRIGAHLCALWVKIAIV